MYRRPRSAGTNLPFKAPRMNSSVAATTQNSEKDNHVNDVNDINDVDVNDVNDVDVNDVDVKEDINDHKDCLSSIDQRLKPFTTIPLKRNHTPPLRPKIEKIKRQKAPEIVPSIDSGPTDSSLLRYFEVVWRKYTTKKNKTWDGDGVIVLSPTYLSLRYDESLNYKEKARMNNPSKFTTDGVFSACGLEIESTGEITNKEQIANIRMASKTTASKNEPKVTQIIKTAPSVSSTSPTSSKSTSAAMIKHTPIIKKEPLRPITRPLVNRQFKPVLPSSEPTITAQKGQPLYDASSPTAIAMSKKKPTDIDVIIDPFIAKNLRPHQIKGVKFLYDCVMGLRGPDISGALLADDMGLGKTLQTITLIWTLLKQSPAGFETPVLSKVLIACPVTLVANWKREFRKWLPMNRVNVMTLYSKNTVTRDRQDLRNFSKTRVYHVLIMGYEKILNMKKELALSNFDLLICDEGHRLKNNSNKTLRALNSLDIEKKVLLTGTPIQNDLNEFFNIIDFINPGILGTFNQFKKSYVNPITRSRELNCTSPEITQLGEDKSLELINLTKPFILRRTASVISNHLPPRTDIVLFCAPTSEQIKLFNEVLGSFAFNKLLQSSISPSGSLGLITMFKKICNSPSLVSGDKTFSKFTDKPSVGQISSGKLQLLIHLLEEFNKVDEKIVIVSNYTQTLDIIQMMVERLNLTYSRLDGSTPNKDRDPLVNSFNKSLSTTCKVFLLSSKSGGVGLNLIGASRLILFDNDWNPSIDLQAMARIHRDGQKKPVFIYRLITTGCIDEKIFQRQLMKNKLSDKFLDDKSKSDDNVFNMSDLKDLFTVVTNTNCNTHQLIQCDCDGRGEDFEDSDDDDNYASGGGDDDASIDNGNGNDNADADSSGGDGKRKKSIPREKKLARTTSWISAKEVCENAQNEDAEKKKSMRKVLSEFKHIDPVHISEESDFSIGDEITENVAINNKKLITYILTKVNKPII